jgi:hypothetical protein
LAVNVSFTSSVASVANLIAEAANTNATKGNGSPVTWRGLYFVHNDVGGDIQINGNFMLNNHCSIHSWAYVIGDATRTTRATLFSKDRDTVDAMSFFSIGMKIDNGLDLSISVADISNGVPVQKDLGSTMNIETWYNLIFTVNTSQNSDTTISVIINAV